MWGVCVGPPKPGSRQAWHQPSLAPPKPGTIQRRMGCRPWPDRPIPATGPSDKSPIHLLQARTAEAQHCSRITAEPQPHHSRIAPETKPNHSHITAASQPNHSHMTGTREPNPLLSNSENSQNHVFQVLIHRRSVCFRITAESQPNHCHIRTGSQPLRNRRSACFKLGPQPNHSHSKAESEPLRVRRSACFML